MGPRNNVGRIGLNYFWSRAESIGRTLWRRQWTWMP